MTSECERQMTSRACCKVIVTVWVEVVRSSASEYGTTYALVMASNSTASSALAWSETSSLHGRNDRNVNGQCRCLCDTRGRGNYQRLLALPLCAKLSLLMEGLPDDGEKRLALTNVLQFVTASRLRLIPEAVMDDAVESVRDLTITSPEAPTISGHQMAKVEDCVFCHQNWWKGREIACVVVTRVLACRKKYTVNRMRYVFPLLLDIPVPT